MCLLEFGTGERAAGEIADDFRVGVQLGLKLEVVLSEWDEVKPSGFRRRLCHAFSLATGADRNPGLRTAVKSRPGRIVALQRQIVVGRAASIRS